MEASFQWLEQSWLGTSVNHSIWAFAAIEAGHLLALAMIGGAVLVVDLRLLGWAFRREPVADIARYAQPWLLGSIIAIVVTGLPLLASLALSKYYFNEAFRLKMYFFAAALLFTFTVRQQIAMGSDARANSWLGKLVAVTSILLWSVVGLMGRGIGFY